MLKRRTIWVDATLTTVPGPAENDSLAAERRGHLDATVALAGITGEGTQLMDLDQIVASLDIHIVAVALGILMLAVVSQNLVHGAASANSEATEGSGWSCDRRLRRIGDDSFDRSRFKRDGVLKRDGYQLI